MFNDLRLRFIEIPRGRTIDFTGSGYMLNKIHSMARIWRPGTRISTGSQAGRRDRTGCKDWTPKHQDRLWHSKDFTGNCTRSFTHCRQCPHAWVGSVWKRDGIYLRCALGDASRAPMRPLSKPMKLCTAASCLLMKVHQCRSCRSH